MLEVKAGLLWQTWRIAARGTRRDGKGWKGGGFESPQCRVCPTQRGRYTYFRCCMWGNQVAVQVKVHWMGIEATTRSFGCCCPGVGCLWDGGDASRLCRVLRRREFQPAESQLSVALCSSDLCLFRDHRPQVYHSCLFLKLSEATVYCITVGQISFISSHHMVCQTRLIASPKRINETASDQVFLFSTVKSLLQTRRMRDTTVECPDLTANTLFLIKSTSCRHPTLNLQLCR